MGATTAIKTTPNTMTAPAPLCSINLPNQLSLENQIERRFLRVW